MKALPEHLRLDEYHISPSDVTQMVFQCTPDAIHPDVIFMPWWQPEVFSLYAGPITPLIPGTLYEIILNGKPVSIIRSGIGAPQAGDAALALGCTPCRRIWFTGSVGGLRPEMRIGDLMLPQFSYAGDGFCRYLQSGPLTNDCFLERQYPDESLTFALAQSATAALANQAGISLHTGPVYCTDTILGQFCRMDFLTQELDCAGIEMESAAVFKAARMVGIQATALLSISDVPVKGQTLYAGRTPQEREYRRETRRKILAKALLDCIQSTEEQ